mmetsp:Transcript_79254/g.256560  ORF Transcript_79254/g.256560 Transcript_79254/m.256560 type:complete len:217 (+) Transcript_79254:655-1305(+)
MMALPTALWAPRAAAWLRAAAPACPRDASARLSSYRRPAPLAETRMPSSSYTRRADRKLSSAPATSPWSTCVAPRLARSSAPAAVPVLPSSSCARRLLRRLARDASGSPQIRSAVPLAATSTLSRQALWSSLTCQPDTSRRPSLRRARALSGWSTPCRRPATRTRALATLQELEEPRSFRTLPSAVSTSHSCSLCRTCLLKDSRPGPISMKCMMLS